MGMIQVLVLQPSEIPRGTSQIIVNTQHETRGTAGSPRILAAALAGKPTRVAPRVTLLPAGEGEADEVISASYSGFSYGLGDGELCC
jgi:hypothetical protein